MRALSLTAVAIWTVACGSTVDSISNSSEPVPSSEDAPSSAQGSVADDGVAPSENRLHDGSTEAAPSSTEDDGGSTSTPTCAVQVASVDLFCADKPFGDAESECAKFGLYDVSRDEGLKGTSVRATQDAYAAIVKSGRGGCEKGLAYRLYVAVEKGDTLDTPRDQDISHVTYCACPKPSASK